MTDTATTSAGPVPTRWTTPLARVVAITSVVFTIGTALHNFAVIDTAVIEEMMRRAGGSDPAGDAPGFTRGFQLVGTMYIVGNAIGVLAWWSRPVWLFWVVLAVNASQGLGWVMIPSEMWPVVIDRHGMWGIVPSVVVDGGGALLALTLLVSLAVRRHTWARSTPA